MRALLYMRQSSDRTGEELAVTRQRDDLLKLVDLRGWTVVAELVDNDISASGRLQRPGFEEALKRLRSGEADVLAAWDLTRISRNAGDTLRLLEVGEKARATLAFVNGTDFNLATADGLTLAGVLTSIAQGEIRKKSERQRRAQLQAAEQGRRVGGRRPFGFERDGVTVRADEATALVRAYDDLLAGVSVARLARDLNEAGLFTPQLRRNRSPSPWRAPALRACLLNPRYAGFRTHVTRDIRERHPLPVYARLAAIVYAADGSPVKPSWPALVPEEVWRAAVELLTDPARFNGPNRIDRALLTGVARCGQDGCTGGVHIGIGGRHGGKQHRVYRCTVRPGHLSRKCVPVDTYVQELVVARLCRPDAAELLVNNEAPDFAALRTEAKALRVKLDSLARLFEEDVLTEASVRERSRTLRARIAELEALQAHPVRDSLLRPVVEAGQLGGFDRAWQVWESMDIDRRRTVIAETIEIRLVAPGRGVRTLRPETIVTRWRQRLA